MGDIYEIINPQPYKNRIKVIGIHENEFNVENDKVLEKIVKQNNLDEKNSCIKILRRSTVQSKKFNMFIELDKLSYEKIAAKKQIIYWLEQL